MQKLKVANLYRSELIPVSGKLVERYNKCLKKLGFSETKLTHFYIDGITNMKITKMGKTYTVN